MTDVGGPGRDPLRLPHPSRLNPDRSDYDSVIDAHERAMDAGEPGYADPRTGLFVMTADFLSERGYCCDQGCRHCPYLDR
jgi:hypothetical protein